MSSAAIDNYLWSVERYLMQRYGSRIAELDVDPLRWYILTGRASAEFLLRLKQVKPFMVARKLHEGGSYDEAISRIKSYLGA